MNDNLRFTQNPSLRIGVGSGKRATKLGDVSGYGAVYYDRSKPGTAYRFAVDAEERLMPGSFNEAVRRRGQIRLLWAHNHSELLGSTRANMSVTADMRGLKFSCSLPDTQRARDTAQLIRDGIVSQCSFDLWPIDEGWKMEGDLLVREVYEIRTTEISIVPNPAYEATSVGFPDLLSKPDEEDDDEDEERERFLKAIRDRATEVELDQVRDRATYVQLLEIQERAREVARIEARYPRKSFITKFNEVENGYGRW